MKCLCCLKPIEEGAPAQEKKDQWHRRCVRSFFHKDALPLLSLRGAFEEEESLATEAAKTGQTVPGVQKKLSLHLSREKNARLTISNYPAGYILKPQSPSFANLPEAEMLIMRLASLSGIKTVPHALIRDPETAALAYITRRVDRTADGGLLAMEDFCQLDGRLSEDKYLGSYERCAKVILKWSSRPGLDLSELFLRVVFSFLAGNSDQHLKNFSLLETAPGNRIFVLSPAYDLLPVNVLMPEDQDETALALNGKKRNLRRSDFLSLAQACQLSEKAAERLIYTLSGLREKLSSLCESFPVSGELGSSMQALISERLSRLLS